MRIAFCVHLYYPKHGAGSEAVAHTVAKYLVAQGHQVRVILMQAKQNNISVPYTYEGVEVIGAPTHLDGYMWADVLITHLDFTQHTIQMGQICNKPVITFVHNSHPYASVISAQRNNYVVYNSQWIADELKYLHPSMVFPPPCDWRKYDTGVDTSKNEHITMVNLDENKGGKILRRLAAAMPDKKFLAVKGAYSEPNCIGQITDLPGNCRVVDNSPDILPIYRQTRILLMPSRYESWGRTATEAMCSGIPIVCTPTPGLKENCQDAAVYVPERGPIDRDKNTGVVYGDDGNSYDIQPMIDAIRALDNQKYYRKMSQRAKDRSRDLDPGQSLHELHGFIQRAVANTQPRQARKATFI